MAGTGPMIPRTTALRQKPSSAFRITLAEGKVLSRLGMGMSSTAAKAGAAVLRWLANQVRQSSDSLANRGPNSFS